MKIKNMKELHRVVGERESWICEYCKKDFSYGYYFNEKNVNQMVCAHHVVRQGADIRQKFNPDVCENVCQNCHNLIHLGKLRQK